MHEGKQKNGSAQPGASHNPCSQALNTDSKPLEVQTWNSLLSQLTAPAVSPESLAAPTTKQCQSLRPTGEAVRRVAVSPACGLPREEAAARTPGL